MPIENSVRSTPDIPKLNGMTARQVWIVKQQSKSAAGSPILSGHKAKSVDEIIAIQNELAAKHGPGTYKFEVFDESGPEKDAWVVRYGNEEPSQYSSPWPSPYTGDVSAFPSGGGGNGSNGSNGNGSNGGGSNYVGSYEVAPGWFYAPALGGVITPRGQLIPWVPQNGPGGAGPAIPGFGAATAASPVPAAAPPWASSMPPFMPWGSMSTTEDKASESKIEALKAELQRQRETSAEDSRRRESQDMRDSFSKMVTDSNSRFEALIAKLAEKPSGPSPEEMLLRSQVEELKRSQESARREDALRAEMRDMQARTEAALRDAREAASAAANNKPDPWAPVLSQMMTAQQSTMAEIARSTREAAQVSATAAERHIDMITTRLGASALTPERTLELIRLAKDQSGSAAVNAGMIDMFKTAFDMSQNVLRMQADMMGQAGGPAWLPIAEQGIQQMGRIATMVASKSASNDAATKKAQAQAQQAARVAQAEHAARVRAEAETAAARRPAAAAAAAAARPRTAADERADAANKVFRGADRTAPPPPPPAAAPAAGAPVSPIEPRRRRRAPAPASDSTSEPTAAPDPATAAEALRRVSALPAEQLREMVGDVPDEEFFGAFLEHVERLREQAAGGALDPEEAASYILQARQFAASAGEFPPAIELLAAGQIIVLVERLLPDALVAFQRAVADAIHVELRSEQAGGDSAEDVA